MRQREVYPFGRTRLVQFIARSPQQGRILSWLTAHSRHERATAFWRLLEAGWRALFGDQDPPSPPAGRNKEDGTR